MKLCKLLNYVWKNVMRYVLPEIVSWAFCLSPALCFRTAYTMWKYFNCPLCAPYGFFLSAGAQQSTMTAFRKAITCPMEWRIERPKSADKLLAQNGGDVWGRPPAAHPPKFALWPCVLCFCLTTCPIKRKYYCLVLKYDATQRNIYCFESGNVWRLN